MKVSGGEAIVKSLVEHKIKTIYGLPGSHILGIYDSLRRESRINHILVMHEVNAAFMADAHGRLTGEPGVCIVTAGAGATNAVTGIAQAYAEASPVVQIAGHSSTSEKVQPDHSVDDWDFLLKIYQPLTKCSIQIQRVEDIPQVMNKAFTIATADRPGPVHLEMPKDVLSSSGKITSFTVNTSAPARSQDTAPHVQRVAEVLESATHPVIAVGKGVLREFCSDEVIRLAKTLCAPILTVPSALSAIPYKCPLYLGYDLTGYVHKYGRWLVHPLISSLVKEADIILTLGFDLGERLTCFKGKSDSVVHIHHDISATDYHDAPTSKPLVDVTGSIKYFITSLLEEIKQKHLETQAMEDRISEIKRTIHDDVAKSIKWGNTPIHPGEISTQLRRVLDDDAIVTLDTGDSESWMRICYKAEKSNTILASGRYSSMGFSLPAAIAAKINFPERQVVAVTGDGGFLMSYMDFPTLVKYGLSVVVIVENNRRYGMIWHMQRQMYGGRTFATEIETPDLAEYARACGATGIEVKTPAALRNALEEAVNTNGPVLVAVDTEYKFPSYLPTRIARWGRAMLSHFPF
jgi:acetolactate synthase-1/2/3 large subunit